MRKGGRVIPDALVNELAALAGVSTEPIGAPLHAVALLTAIAGEIDPPGGDPLSQRRHRVASRRLAAHAVMAAATIHGAFGDRPDLERARSRVLVGLPERAHQATATSQRALGAVAAAALQLPPLEHDTTAEWQLGAIAFVDEELLRALYDACVELAAVALRDAGPR